MRDFNARFQFAIFEARADLRVCADAVDLVVVIVGIAEPVAHRVDTAFADAPFATACPFLLAQVDVVLHSRGIDAGDEVGHRRVLKRHTDEPAIEDVGASDRVALGAIAGIGLNAAGDAIVAGLPGVGVGMDRDVAAAGIELHGTVAAIADAVEAAARFECNSVLRNRGGNAVVAGADHAADGLRAIAQRAGAANDLDALRRQWVDRHRMVFPQIGHVGGADAVLLGSHPEAAEAPDHRTARHRRERRRRDTGRGAEGVAERSRAASEHLLRRKQARGGEWRVGGRLFGRGRQRVGQGRWRRRRGRCRDPGAPLHRLWGTDGDLRQFLLSTDLHQWRPDKTRQSRHPDRPHGSFSCD